MISFLYPFSSCLLFDNQFVIYIEWQKVLMEYPEEVRLEVYDAIIKYAASETLSEQKPLAKMAFYIEDK